MYCLLKTEPHARYVAQILHNYCNAVKILDTLPYPKNPRNWGHAKRAGTIVPALTVSLV
jgi:hypothetical protein